MNSAVLTQEMYFAMLEFAPHPAQWAIIQDPRKHLILNCGRRFGKSLLGVNHRALPTLLAGQRGWWIAPSMLIAQEGLHYMRKAAEKLERRGLLRPPTGDRLYKSTPVPHFQTDTGGLFEFRTTGKDSRQANLVGSGLQCIILDEAARISHLLWLMDEQLEPTLFDTGGRWMIFSTPRGKRAEFAKLRQRAAQHPGTWGSHSYSTYENPHLTAEALAEFEARGTPQLLRQELYAEEIDDFGAFFPHVAEIKPETPLLWTGWGWDYAMGGTAAFVKVVEDAAHRLIAVEERAGPLTWEAQVRFAGQQRQAGYDVIVDPHLEETFRADLARHSIVTRPGTSDRRGSLELLRVWLNTDLAGLAPGSCPYLKTELADAEIDERDCEEMTKDARDHAIDAFRYAFIFRWPRAKVYHTPPKSPSDSLEAMIRRMDRAEKVRR